MDRYDATSNPKNPPNSVLGPRVRSAALHLFIGSLVAFFLLVGVALLFWTVANPRPAATQQRESVGGPSGYYSTEGGHNPDPRPGNTQDELKFRGALTPPTEVRSR